MHVPQLKSPFVIRRRSAVAATIAGLCDTSIAFAYLTQVDLVWWYSTTLIIKCLVAATLVWPGIRNLRAHSVALPAFAAILMGSAWLGGAESSAWLAAIGFTLHLVITLTLVDVGYLRNYLSASAFVGAALGIFYLGFVVTGQIDVVFGRYLFFGGTQPNLGGEILAVTVVAAAVAFPLRSYLICFAICVVPVLLMQSRSSLVVFALSLSTKIFSIPDRRKRRFAIAAIGVVFIVVILAGPLKTLMVSGVGKVLLLDDPRRGLGTGFAGRDARWSAALEQFLSSPVLGSGFGFYQKTGLEGAHNFFMYGLVEFGLLALIIFGYGIFCMYRIWRFDRRVAWYLSPLLIMTLFNDRFINLNPYPFVMIVVLLVASSRLPYDTARR